MSFSVKATPGKLQSQCLLSCRGKTQFDRSMISPESVEKAFNAVRWLIFEDFDAAFHLWTRNRLLAVKQALKCDGGANMVVLTSILDDLAKAPTGWT